MSSEPAGASCVRARLSNITVELADDGTVIATGGKRHVYDPWRIDDGTDSLRAHRLDRFSGVETA